MPIYEYQAVEAEKACAQCRGGFEYFHRSMSRLSHCPRCGAALKKLISTPTVGSSASGADDRAKSAGFHKLKKVSTGEYEKLY